MEIENRRGQDDAEELFVYGGYSKVRNASNVHAVGGGGQQQQQQEQHRTSGSEGIVHVDCWTLPLKSLLSDGGGIEPGFVRLK